MHRTSPTQEIIVALLFVVMLVIFLNPGGALWLPSMASTIMLGGLIVIFGVFMSLVLNESPEDEREVRHRAFAGRIAYVAGFMTLVVATTVQLLDRGSIDSWLLITMVVMVLAKVIARSFASRYR